MAYGSKALSISYCVSKSWVEFFYFLPKQKNLLISIDFSQSSSWGLILKWIEITFNCILRIITKVKFCIFCPWKACYPLENFDRFFSTFLCFIRIWIESTFNCLLRIKITSKTFLFFAKTACPLTKFERFFSTCELMLHSCMERKHFQLPTTNQK